MPQDTAGPEGAAKALAAAKAALSTADKKFPSPADGGSAAETAKAPYKMATDQRKKSNIFPAGDTGGQELKQAEENANQLKEATKAQP